MRIRKFVEGKHIGEANVVHQNIQFVIQIAKDPTDAIFYPNSGPQIGHRRNHSHAKIPSLLSGGLKLGLIAIKKRYRRTFTGKRQSRRSSDTARSPSDKNSLARKPCIHSISLCSSDRNLFG
jgi:hypothetical protein